MPIPHKYVRRKNASTEVLMSGYSHFEGLFDPDEFEEIEGPLPENYSYINTEELVQGEKGLRSKTFMDKFKGIFGSK